MLVLWDGGRGNRSLERVIGMHGRDGNKLPKNLRPERIKITRFDHRWKYR